LDAAALVRAKLARQMSDHDCEVVACAVSLLMGEEGRRKHLDEVTEIRGRGEILLLVVTVLDGETALANVVGVAKPTRH
jgi:hypothetical protein